MYGVQNLIRSTAQRSPEFLYEPSLRVIGSNGNQYRVRVCACAMADGSCAGWIEFVPIGGAGFVVRALLNAPQASRAALAHWAAQLDRSFYEAALRHALGGRGEPLHSDPSNLPS
jgi:hypothetical protein